MLLSAIFLTLIVSIMATMILNANAKIKQRNSTLYFTAINLANEQFAIIESGQPYSIPAEDLRSYNGVDEDSAPIIFEISTSHTGNKYTVKVEWNINGETKTFESVKTILPKNFQ